MKTDICNNLKTDTPVEENVDTFKEVITELIKMQGKEDEKKILMEECKKMRKRGNVIDKNDLNVQEKKISKVIRMDISQLNTNRICNM